MRLSQFAGTEVGTSFLDLRALGGVTRSSDSPAMIVARRIDRPYVQLWPQ
jgi:hypothetical protein